MKLYYPTAFLAVVALLFSACDTSLPSPNNEVAGKKTLCAVTPSSPAFSETGLDAPSGFRYTNYGGVAAACSEALLIGSFWSSFNYTASDHNQGNHTFHNVRAEVFVDGVKVWSQLGSSMNPSVLAQVNFQSNIHGVAYPASGSIVDFKSTHYYEYENGYGSFVRNNSIVIP
jgi:hypothetical protein